MRLSEVDKLNQLVARRGDLMFRITQIGTSLNVMVGGTPDEALRDVVMPSVLEHYRAKLLDVERQLMVLGVSLD